MTKAAAVAMQATAKATAVTQQATAKAAAPAALTARAPHEHSAFMLQRMCHFFLTLWQKYYCGQCLG